MSTGGRQPRGFGPTPGASPRPLYVNMIRGLWKPMVIIYALWVPALVFLLYLRYARWMPLAWYVPLLVTLIIAGILPGAVGVPIWMARLQRRVIRAHGKLCPNCLYDLRDLEEADHFIELLATSGPVLDPALACKPAEKWHTRCDLRASQDGEVELLLSGLEACNVLLPSAVDLR